MPQLIPFFFVNQNFDNYVTNTDFESLQNDLSIFLVIFFTVSIILLTITLFKGPSAVTGSPPKIKPPKGLQVPRVWGGAD